MSPLQQSRSDGEFHGLSVKSGMIYAGKLLHAPDYCTTRTEALALSGSHLFDPMGGGRPMKEWVEVSSEHASQWFELAQAAYRYADKTGK